ncbi:MULTISPECIES: YhgE/Pip domain-containing protein [unclassified Microbacterium]|uniref:YhgE/Pip domain-containing protein n=1 Tax=unclassified Microbacterium TaxID=2609290 RepID=UPI001D20F2CA|nr:YhgE/Pip domain-containing protein [Microbacterium sp. USTB-Y]MBS1898124.1 YhgE/Pip domain-containing protein [Actinomycetota bacterium]
MKIPAMIGAELRRLTASPMAVIALIALMAVPILYGGLYLWANQDPYGKFTEVPVGLVVEDTGATSGDTTTNYGEKVADNLVEGKAFDWQRLSAPAARAALKNGDVDFTVTIPKTFSEALLSSSGTSPHQARIELETNDANNYLASSIGSGAVEKIRRSVAEMVGQEAADKLLTGLSDVRDKLGEAADGAGKLSDGANTAVSGSGQLADGTTQLADGAAQLAGGTAQIADGSQQLADGAATLANGAQQVSDGNQQIAQYANEAGSLVQQATDTLPQVRSDIAAALADRGLSPSEIDAVLAKLDPLGDKLRSGNDTVQGAVGKIDQLADGSAQVASGSATLADKSQQLANGAQTAASGAATLSSGAASARDGAKALHDGLGTLANGIVTLRDGLAAGVDAIPASTPELRSEQAKTIANPVDVSSDKVAAAKDYGQGLAPFFAALAGWIGIYALFLIIKPISRRAVTALHSPIRITLAGWLTPAAFGALQMLGLLGVLAWALGFTFQNGWGALGIMVLASATYAAIILALNVWLGSVGQFMGLVLMVLQLVTAGGTFPWQTLPTPLTALHHVLPMGYVVDAMRQLMYGGQVGRAMTDLGVLGIWLVGSLLIAMIGVTRMTHKRTLRDLQPSLIG